MATRNVLKLEQPRESQEARIRAVFVEHLGGAATTAETVRECRRRGVWTFEELERKLDAGCASDVRKALRGKDTAGLPFCGQTVEANEDGAQVWKQRSFWSFDDYELNIRELVAQRDESHRLAMELARECEDRHKRAPSITPIEDRRS